MQSMQPRHWALLLGLKAGRPSYVHRSGSNGSKCVLMHRCELLAAERKLISSDHSLAVPRCVVPFSNSLNNSKSKMMNDDERRDCMFSLPKQGIKLVQGERDKH